MSDITEQLAEALRKSMCGGCNPANWERCCMPDARDALAAFDAQQSEQPTGWRPIETAPRDGTFVQVWPPTYTGVASCARWCEDKHSSRPRPYWSRTDAMRTTTSREKQPTHWMPLPPPPQP